MRKPSVETFGYYAIKVAVNQSDQNFIMLQNLWTRNHRNSNVLFYRNDFRHLITHTLMVGKDKWTTLA